MGRGALAQRAHPDDQDQRCVVLRWDGVVFAQMGPPDDEGRQTHRLYAAGLGDVLRLGIVRDSALVVRFRPWWRCTGGDPGFRVAPLHYVVVSKECVVEVLAENVDELRVEGSPSQAAAAAGILP